MTITCLHCGPIRVVDATIIRSVTRVVDALAAEAAPLGGISCPMCGEEVDTAHVALERER